MCEKVLIRKSSAEGVRSFFSEVLGWESIIEFNGAQIIEDNKLTEAGIECVLVDANTNTHSTSLADSAVLGWCQGYVHLFLMLSPRWSRNTVCLGLSRSVGGWGLLDGVMA